MFVLDLAPMVKDRPALIMATLLLAVLLMGRKQEQNQEVKQQEQQEVGSRHVVRPREDSDRVYNRTSPMVFIGRKYFRIEFNKNKIR